MHTDRHAISGQAPSLLSKQWGSAAGAKIQTSPGVSALAAPHQIQGARAQWLGVLEAAVLLGGFGGLIGGLYLLATSPLPGVVTILASMTLMLSTVGKLGEAQEVRQRCGVTQVRAQREPTNLGHRSCFPR